MFGCSIATSGLGDDLTFTSTLTPTQSQALVLMATISAKQALKSTGTLDAIYIKDGDTVIDTSRALKTARDEISDLRHRLQQLLENSYMYDQVAESAGYWVGYRIDNYSTAVDDTQTGLISIGAYMELNNISEGKALMQGYDNS